MQCFVFFLATSHALISPDSSCSVGDYDENNDRGETTASAVIDNFQFSLQPMEYTVGRRQQHRRKEEAVKGTFLAYVQPDIASFYSYQQHGDNNDRKSYDNYNGDIITKVEPSFRGRTGKFMNLSNETVRFFVIHRDEADDIEHFLLRTFVRFSAHFITGYPDQEFYFAPIDSLEPLISWRIKMPDANKNRLLYVYDPYSMDAGKMRLALLSLKEQSKYHRFQTTLEFHHQYEQFTGRAYLQSTIRPRVQHPMFKAERVGQEHTIETQETHFVRLVPPGVLEPIFGSGQARVLETDEPRMLSGYRALKPGQTTPITMNMTLRVLSCAPRIFEVRQFLSQVEVEHLLELGRSRVLKQSSQGGKKRKTKNTDTQDARTSKNTWIKREQSQITDAIYRRAADLLHLDEALLRSRDSTEVVNVTETKSIAESMQLVYYAEGQHYATHQVSQKSQYCRILLRRQTCFYCI